MTAPVIICMSRLLWTVAPRRRRLPLLSSLNTSTSAAPLMENLMQKKQGVCSQVIGCLYNSSATFLAPHAWNMNETWMTWNHRRRRGRRAHNRADRFVGAPLDEVTVFNLVLRNLTSHSCSSLFTGASPQLWWWAAMFLKVHCGVFLLLHPCCSSLKNTESISCLTHCLPRLFFNYCIRLFLHPA